MDQSIQTFVIELRRGTQEDCDQKSTAINRLVRQGWRITTLDIDYQKDRIVVTIVDSRKYGF